MSNRRWDFVNFRGFLRKHELYNNFSKFVYWLSENDLDVRSTYPMKLESTYFTKLISDNAILLHWCTTHNMSCAHLLQIHICKSLILWNFLTNTPYRFEKDGTQIHTACLGSFPFPVTRWIAYILAIFFFVKSQRIGLNLLV